MEKYHVKKLADRFDKVVSVPGSKSITNRALLMAALAEGTTVLNGVLFSNDSRCFLQSLISLGYEIQIEEKDARVTITGHGSRLPKSEGSIYVGSAGTAARFLTSMLALSDGVYEIQASEQMKARPMRPLFDALESLGAEFTYLEKEGFLPVRVKGCKNASAKTKIAEASVAEVAIDISKSTQFLSALMMTGIMLENGICIRITSEKKEGSYIRITTKMMEQFGCHVTFDGAVYTVAKGERYQACTYQIEPDVSAACYFYGAAVMTGSTILVRNVHSDCMQGDIRFFEVLKAMGATYTEEEEGIRLTGPQQGIYPGITVNMNDFSDQALTLAAMAAFATTETHIQNIAHIRLQESDRIQAMITNLNKIGANCESEDDGVVIHSIRPENANMAEIETFEDHRVAMSFALLGMKMDGITILDPMCCSKTFENYFSVLETLYK